MAAVYANENFPLPVVTELRNLGHDVLTSQESGNAGWAVADEEVLAFASSKQRAVVTLNRKHFVRLHQLSPDHEGIIVCTYDPDWAAQAERIHRALEAEITLRGMLIRVNRPAASGQIRSS